MTIVYECPESRRDVLTASGDTLSRADAEALGYTVAPYANLVAPSERIASRHPECGDLVTLPPFGLAVVPHMAKALGFAVSNVSTAPQVARSQPSSLATWRSAIIESPEATGRDEATAELLTKHSPETLSVDDARAFLRGLPTEQPERKVSNVTKTEDPRAARKTEIANSMTAFNANSGYTGRNAARSVNSQVSTSLSGIDPAKLKRLAELRLNALESGQAHRVGDEAKKLRYALQVHDQTGLPLANVFTQLSVDTSKFVR